ncbi:YebC/PmpR family DNA-binding transcriptional regulator [bacterium]|nr:YebC/PmpR family DNA-binding transcriptional regulator [bacterium]
MSGHNKWSSIKHRKAAQDAKRGAAFNKVIRELVVAAKEGGADPATNFALASAIERAKSANMPKDTMEKAIKRGAGESGGEDYQRISYEGRGPGGTAFIIETLTDNKNRTVAEVRHIFAKAGGQLGETGSAAWLFDRKGLVVIKEGPLTEDALMEACLEAGADDFKIDGEVAEIYSTVEDLQAVQQWFRDSGKYKIDRVEPAMIPKDPVEITEVAAAKKLLRMLDALDEQDDVQNVFSNWSMSDELVEEAAG